MVKKILPKICVALWLGLLLALGIYYLLLAPRESTFSQKENRMLTGFPAVTAENILSGTFGKEFETYLLDRFPGRNAVIDAANRMESLTSFASHEEYLLIAEHAKDPLVGEGSQVDMDDLLADFNNPTEPDVPGTVPPAGASATESEETGPVENPPIEPKPAASPEDFPENPGMYINIGNGEEALEQYYRDYVLASVTILNRCARLLPENGKLMFTVAPSSYRVIRFQNAEERISFYTTWDEMINALSDDNVYAFDTCEIFSEHVKNDEYVAFRTDIHWTPYGNHLIYSTMAAQAGKTPSQYPDDFEITVDDTFQGSLFRDHPSTYWNVEPDVLEYLTPKVDFEYRKITGVDEYTVVDYLDMSRTGTERYTAYLGGPAGPWHYFQCDNGQTENCLVICDSFGLSFVPLLTHNYNQVHYYEPRRFNREIVGYSVSEMIEKYNIHDIYVVMGDFHVFNSESLLHNVNNQLG